MATRISASMLVGIVLFSLIGIGVRPRPALAAGLQCGSVADLGIPAITNRRFSVTSPLCFRMSIPPGLTRLRVYVWTQQGILNLYMGQTQATQAKLVIDTSQTSAARVTRSHTPYNARSLTPGYLILALGPLQGSVEGDIVAVKSEFYKPPPPKPAPSSSGSVSSVSSPLDGSVNVDLSPVSVAPKVLGKAQPPLVVVVPPAVVIEPVVPAAPVEPAVPAAPAESPTSPPPDESAAPAQPPAAPQPQPQPQPAANTGNIDPFPCSRAGIGVSNLCIEQPYPVRRGATAFVVWNIADFSYGEFDRGDGQGFKGPIYGQQRVDVPSINSPRTVRLRWLDKSGAERIDTFTIQVVD